ncbi:MAG: hypothetical protein U1F68_14945 [Gammaproteobacteria bacterium]
MDIATGIVGEKRKISWQGLAEALYMPPQSGFTPETFSKQQLRRAANMLEKAGLLQAVSVEKQLIFKCPLADRGYSVQNQVGTKPTHHADTKPTRKKETKTNGYDNGKSVGRHSETLQADTHLLSLKKTSSSTVVDDGHPEEKIRVTPTAAALRIPYQQIVDLYHQILPASQRVKELTEARRKHIKARWASGELPDIDTWREYFQHVAQSKFLTGREHAPDRAPYFAPFDWLITQRAYVNILEGKYHRTRASAHGQVSRRTH